MFPSIYRDMRHPRKFRKGLNITFGFTVSGKHLYDRTETHARSISSMHQWLLWVYSCLATLYGTRSPPISFSRQAIRGRSL